MIHAIQRAFVLAAVAIAGAVSFACGVGAETGAAPTSPFDRLCGTLPVSADQIVGIDPHTADGRPSKGVVIRVASEAQAVAPCAGRVVYQGEFRGYGNLLIISVAGGYHILLAGLSTFDVTLGQTVTAGEAIGTLPRSSAGGAVPSLRIEVRKAGHQRIDPAVLWRKS
jgi:murein DD-endopeptidase MepM/ murein hydrolase activator NlpD